MSESLHAHVSFSFALLNNPVPRTFRVAVEVDANPGAENCQPGPGPALQPPTAGQTRKALGLCTQQNQGQQGGLLAGCAASTSDLLHSLCPSLSHLRSPCRVTRLCACSQAAAAPSLEELQPQSQVEMSPQPRGCGRAAPGQPPGAPCPSDPPLSLCLLPCRAPGGLLRA